MSIPLHGVIRCAKHGVTHRTNEPVGPSAYIFTADLIPTAPKIPPLNPKKHGAVMCTLCGKGVELTWEPAA